MASITIRRLDNTLKEKLRIRAARAGRSMEEEVRCILQTVLGQEETPKHLGLAIHRRFEALNGFDLPPVERPEIRNPVEFDL